MDFRFFRAIITGKIGNAAISMIDRNRGTIWAGKKALKIDPELLTHFTGIDPQRVIFVTGTNGKSTVSNMITHILRTKGYKVISNSEGANLTTGVAAALVKKVSLSGSVKADYCVFETDERYLAQIREQLPCANLLVTNLQKDQVQRNGDPDFVYRKIADVAGKYGMRLFLNGDEPRSCSLAEQSDKVVFYGVGKHSQAFRKDQTFVTLPCPKCRSRIRFSYYNNDGMGGFKCDRCGYSNNNGRESADYTVTDTDFESGTFRIGETGFSMPYKQTYMLYNYAAAAAVCRELAGISEEESAEAIKSFKVPEGRIEQLKHGNQIIKYYRFKQENPETLQNFLNAVASDPEEKVVVIGFGTVSDYDPYYINSFYAFDCDYTVLKGARVKKYIFVTDTIAYDAANCFIYGGVDPSIVEILPTSDEEEIFDAITASGCSNIYLSVKLHMFEEMKQYAGKGR